MSKAPNTWEELLGEENYRDALQSMRRIYDTLKSEDELPDLLGFLPHNREVCSIWKDCAAHFRARVQTVFYSGGAREDFMGQFLPGLAHKNLPPSGASALAEHLKKLYEPDDEYVPQYASAWGFPDGYVPSDDFIIYTDTNGPAGLALLDYRGGSEPHASIETVQGARKGKVDLLGIADRVLASFAPFHAAGWPLYVRVDGAYPIYPAMRDRYAYKKPEKPAPESSRRVLGGVTFHRINESKQKVKKLLGIA